MPAIITIASPKGGGGKSTTATELAVYLARQQLKVLCIDQDNIGSLTNNFLGADRSTPADTVIKLYNDPDHVNELIPTKVNEFIDLMPADENIEDIMRQNSINTFDNLEENLTKIKGFTTYDTVIFDTPAGNGNTVVASLIASDLFISPIDLEQNSISAIKQLSKIVQPIKKRFNPNLFFAGFIINRVTKFNYDPEHGKIPNDTDQRKIYYRLLDDYGRDAFIGLVGIRKSIVAAASKGEWIRVVDQSSQEAEKELTQLYDNVLTKIQLKRI